MPLLLKRVEPARGLRWLVDAFRLFARRPLGFTLMFSVFLFGALLVSLVPLIGGLLQLMSLPLLSLGFMVASQSALMDGPVRPSHFIEPLQGDPARRRALLVLCASYGAAAVVILLLCDVISGGAMHRLQALMVQGTVPESEVDAVLDEPGFTVAVIVGLTLGTLLAVPYWHAPALVHWGAQSAGQALFSSTLAVWRSKGAFFVYGVAWLGVAVAFGLVMSLLSGLLGLSQLGSLLALPAGLMCSTVFYVSLLYTFNDSFGSAEAPPLEGPGA